MQANGVVWQEQIVNVLKYIYQWVTVWIWTSFQRFHWARYANRTVLRNAGLLEK
jgi:hypothetical protein